MDGPGKRGSNNQGQSGHQSWHQPVDGTARKDQHQRVQPESTDVRRKPAIRRGAKTSTEMDKELYPARSRSSMIVGDHQRSRTTIATILQSTPGFLLYLLHLRDLLDYRNYRASFVSSYRIHTFRTQEGKTGSHMSTRRA